MTTPNTIAAAVPARMISATRTVLGTILLVRPEQIGGTLGGPSSAIPPSWIVRVLGARLALQGVLELALPSPLVLRLGASADAAHAASMLPVLRSERYRQVAAISAAVAATTAALSFAAARSGRDRR